MKISCIAVAFFVLVSAVPAYAQSPAPEATEITATVQRFHEALAQGDPKVAMEMLAPDAVILESGAMQAREEYARELAGRHRLRESNVEHAFNLERWARGEGRVDYEHVPNERVI